MMFLIPGRLRDTPREGVKGSTLVERETGLTYRDQQQFLGIFATGMAEHAVYWQYTSYIGNICKILAKHDRYCQYLS